MTDNLLIRIIETTLIHGYIFPLKNIEKHGEQVSSFLILIWIYQLKIPCTEAYSTVLLILLPDVTFNSYIYFYMNRRLTFCGLDFQGNGLGIATDMDQQSFFLAFKVRKCIFFGDWSLVLYFTLGYQRNTLFFCVSYFQQHFWGPVLFTRYFSKHSFSLLSYCA